MPLTDVEFAASMDRLGPFEPEPHLCVAVSGGADSMALCLLAAKWASARGGRLSALTVDHGLRAGSGDEARQVGTWLAAHGIKHKILRWTGGKPASDLQAAAREARYRLLETWCARAGVLHLLIAHHRQDQAETFLLRLERGSGLTGLSAMAPIMLSGPVRRLRPLLEFDRDRLTARLLADRQDWIEDPSNRDEAFARVRVRKRLSAHDDNCGGDNGASPARLAETAMALGRARNAIDNAVGDLAAGCVTIFPAGFACLSLEPFAMAPVEVGFRLLANLLQTVGGGPYPPRSARLTRLYGALTRRSPFKARTLAGCRIIPSSGGLLIVREPAAIAPPVRIVAGGGASLVWDRRFLIEWRLAPRGRALDGLKAGEIGSLGSAGWRDLQKMVSPAALPSVPAPARAGIPCIRRCGRLIAVPFANLAESGDKPYFMSCRFRFRPSHAVAGPSFAVV